MTPADAQTFRTRRNSSLKTRVIASSTTGRRRPTGASRLNDPPRDAVGGLHRDGSVATERDLTGLQPPRWRKYLPNTGAISSDDLLQVDRGLRPTTVRSQTADAGGRSGARPLLRGCSPSGTARRSQRAVDHGGQAEGGSATDDALAVRPRRRGSSPSGTTGPSPRVPRHHPRVTSAAAVASPQRRRSPSGTGPPPSTPPEHECRAKERRRGLR